MARSVRDAKLDTRAARGRLPAQKKPHWRCLIPGQLHLGYRKRRADAPGTWTARRYLGLDAAGVGRYSSELIGLADDYEDADGSTILSFADAQRLALTERRERIEEASRPMTVAQALTDYEEHVRAERPKAVRDIQSKARNHILPAFGSKAVADLTTDELSRWRDRMAAAPARLRSRPGEAARHKPAAEGDAVRARRATVNRTVTVLKAALNHAFRLGRVNDDLAWRRLTSFAKVGSARPGFLTADEARRLVNAADEPSGFRSLVQAALTTGCRYGELCGFEVRDFARDRLHVRKSKSGKARDVFLTDEGRAFFAALCAGRASNEPIFRREDGGPWGPSHQSRPMAAACRAAGVPVMGFHQLRHTYASLTVMNGTQMLVVAGNLGHADTRMVEKHYGHLTESYIEEAIRRGAPSFGFVFETNVTPLRRAPG